MAETQTDVYDFEHAFQFFGDEAPLGSPNVDFRGEPITIESQRVGDGTRVSFMFDELDLEPEQVVEMLHGFWENGATGPVPHPTLVAEALDDLFDESSIFRKSLDSKTLAAVDVVRGIPDFGLEVGKLKSWLVASDETTDVYSRVRLIPAEDSAWYVEKSLRYINPHLLQELYDEVPHELEEGEEPRPDFEARMKEFLLADDNHKHTRSLAGSDRYRNPNTLWRRYGEINGGQRAVLNREFMDSLGAYERAHIATAFGERLIGDLRPIEVDGETSYYYVEGSYERLLDVSEPGDKAEYRAIKEPKIMKYDKERYTVERTVRHERPAMRPVIESGLEVEVPEGVEKSNLLGWTAIALMNSAYTDESVAGAADVKRVPYRALVQSARRDALALFFRAYEADLHSYDLHEQLAEYVDTLTSE